MSGAIAFLKAHGTGNDFVLLPDADAPSVSSAQVVSLCNRRFGLGADGVLQVRRTADCDEVADQAGEAEWFMDYRNADGSSAQMCGNGARVFAAHLLDSGLVNSDSFAIATRGGVRRIRREAQGICVEMGVPDFLDDVLTVVPVGGPVEGFSAMGVHIPNPHAVAWVASLEVVGSLLELPVITPLGVFAEGVNIEFVSEVSEDHLRMRVYERGVGETLSCGTGACAAVVATLRRRGCGPEGQRIRMDVPGGELSVTWLRDGAVELTGPVAFVARGTLDSERWGENG